MRIAGEGAQFTNNVILVGALDPGGFFTMDATVIPDQPGELQLLVEVGYTDDFNAPQTITETLTVTVLDGGQIGVPTDGSEGGPVEPPVTVPESLWDKLLRFVRGLLGLDSGQTNPGGSPGPDVKPTDSGPNIVPIGPGKG